LIVQEVCVFVSVEHTQTMAAQLSARKPFSNKST
jgi:hypothetical protein